LDLSAAYFCGIPLSRARCITDPIGSKSRAFVFKHGCSQIVADASVINASSYGTWDDPAKIEVIGSAVDLEKFKPPRDPTKFRREIGITTTLPLLERRYEFARQRTARSVEAPVSSREAS